MSWRDPEWKYKRSVETNIRKTFERERKRLREADEAKKRVMLFKQKVAK